MEKNVGVELQKWAEHMGYLPPVNGVCDKKLNFGKLCNPQTEPLWGEVVATVKPLPVLDDIRKNIILSRIRKGTFQSNGKVSGSLGTQLKMQRNLKQLQKQKNELLSDLENYEMSLRDIKKNLIKKQSKISLVQSQLKDAEVKSELLKIKKTDCESLVSWLDNLTSVANNLFPSSSAYSALQKKNAMEALEKCAKVVGEYQIWYREVVKSNPVINQEEHQAELEQRKVSLWKTVSACVSKIPPELLWQSLTTGLMESNMSEMASMASSVDLKSDVDALRLESECGGRPSQAMSTMLIRSMTDTADYIVKTNILTSKLEQLIGETADNIEQGVTAKSDFDPTNSAKLSREKILECLRRRCRRCQLQAAKQVLMNEVSEFRKKSLDLASCAQRLKEEKAAVSILDDQIAEAKMFVEQGLVSINDTRNKLENARQGVKKHLENFSANHQPLFSTESVFDSGHSDTMNRSLLWNRTANPSDGLIACSTPAPNSHGRKDPRIFSIDESAITNDCGVESTASTRNASDHLNDVVATLRNAVSQESKSFFKLPLELVPKVKLSLSTQEITGVLINSTELIARLSCGGSSSSKQLAQLYQLCGTTPSPQLLVTLYQNLGHVRAAKIRNLVGNVQPPQSLSASISLHYLKVTAPDQDDAIRHQLGETSALVENTAEILKDCGEHYNSWVERPIQHILPETRRVDGMTYNEWKEKYDYEVKRLEQKRKAC